MVPEVSVHLPGSQSPSFGGGDTHTHALPACFIAINGKDLGANSCHLCSS